MEGAIQRSRRRSGSFAKKSKISSTSTVDYVLVEDDPTRGKIHARQPWQVDALGEQRQHGRTTRGRREATREDTEAWTAVKGALGAVQRC